MAPFLPINPGKEERSREPPHGEALNRFFEGTCAGDSEQPLIDEVQACLPENPNW